MQVCMGALLKCSFGVAPSALMFYPPICDDGNPPRQLWTPAAGECASVWDVPVPREPYGNRRDNCRAGSADSDAVYPGDACALGTGVAYREDRKHARSEFGREVETGMDGSYEITMRGNLRS